MGDKGYNGSKVVDSLKENREAEYCAGIVGDRFPIGVDGARS
jgi:hypothetical protein